MKYAKVQRPGNTTGLATLKISDDPRRIKGERAGDLEKLDHV